MLSLVLPLTVLAIVLTPVVASASIVYKREVDAYNCQFSDVESNTISSIELNN